MEACVREGVRAHLPQARVHGCYWGDLALDQFDGLSLPSENEGTMGIGDGLAGAEPNLDDLRAMLLVDPHLELRAMMDVQRIKPSGGGIDSSPAAVRDRNARLLGARDAVAGVVVAQITRGIVDVPAGIVEKCVGDALVSAAQCDRRVSEGDLIEPLARAITAAIGEAAAPLNDPESTYDWDRVEACVRGALAGEFGAQMGGPVAWAKSAALLMATPALARMRPAIISRMATFIGDCFIYLKDADKILARLDETIAKHSPAADEPLWLVGHSMGGIIAFDYASRGQRRIERLITVGSQVGLFAELHSLQKLTSPGADGRYALPESVGVWRNVYDRDDMLSFTSARVFAGATDFSVDTGAPFPLSHSAYWDRPDVYNVICGG
jgi:hypothetical protein